MNIKVLDDGIIPHSPFTINYSLNSNDDAKVTTKEGKSDAIDSARLSEQKNTGDLCYVKQMIFTSEMNDTPDVELEIDDISSCGDINIDSVLISKSTIKQLLDMDIELDDVFAFGKRIKRSKSGWWSTRSCDIRTRGVVALLNLATLPGYVFTLQTEQALLYWTTPYGKPNQDNVQFYAQIGKYGLVQFHLSEPDESLVVDENISEKLQEVPGWIVEALDGFIHQRIMFKEVDKDEITSHVKTKDVKIQ